MRALLEVDAYLIPSIIDAHANEMRSFNASYRVLREVCSFQAADSLFSNLEVVASLQPAQIRAIDAVFVSPLLG